MGVHRASWCSAGAAASTLRSCCDSRLPPLWHSYRRHCLSAPPHSHRIRSNSRTRSPFDESLHFAGWGSADFVSFDSHCWASTCVTPYDAEQEGALEAWVMCDLGEFVYFAMPELTPMCRRSSRMSVRRCAVPATLPSRSYRPAMAHQQGAAAAHPATSFGAPTPGRLNAELSCETRYYGETGYMLVLRD